MPEQRRIRVEPSELPRTMEELRGSGYDYLLSLSAVDEPGEGRIRLVYHIARSSDPRDVVVVETAVPREKPEAPSIAGIYPAALMQEREEHEMLGVRFRGHPDLRRLLLPPDWPPGVYPLRKDFKVYEEPVQTTKRSKPIWLLKPELRPGGENQEH